MKDRARQVELFDVSTTTRIETPVDLLRKTHLPPELAADAEDTSRTIGDLPRKLRLRADEVATLLECDENHIYRMIDDGTLDAINIAPALIENPRPIYRVYTYSVAKLLDDRRKRAGRRVADHFRRFVAMVSIEAAEVCHFIGATREDFARTMGDLPGKLRMRADEVARFLDVDENHIYRMIDDGTLDAVNIARYTDTRPMYRVYTYSLARLLTERREGAWQ